MSEQFDAGERLLRLLALLAYLAQVGEANLADLAAQFSMDERTLVSELELAACCGLPPYTPDQLLELVIDDGVVRAYGLEALRRPPRLTPDEGFTLAACARAMLSVSGVEEDGPLAGALGKLEAALGESRVLVWIEGPDHLLSLRSAAADNEMVEIDYLGSARDEATTRLVEPSSVIAREGKFYLDAFCHLANDWRRFQVARITAVRQTGRHGAARTPPTELSGSRAFSGGSSVRTARVGVPRDHAALLDRIAVAPGEPGADEMVVFTIEVADEAWFGRLMLRLGRDATVLDPPELVDAAAKVARRALERYRPRH